MGSRFAATFTANALESERHRERHKETEPDKERRGVGPGAPSALPAVERRGHNLSSYTSVLGNI